VGIRGQDEGALRGDIIGQCSEASQVQLHRKTSIFNFVCSSDLQMSDQRMLLTNDVDPKINYKRKKRKITWFGCVKMLSCSLPLRVNHRMNTCNMIKCNIKSEHHVHIRCTIESKYLYYKAVCIVTCDSRTLFLLKYSKQ
jgi:hypothetical protein